MVLIVTAAAAALSLSGCGGSTATGNSVRIRGIDAATNSPAADISVNGSSAFGDMNYFEVTSYQYMSQGALDFTSLIPNGNTPIFSQSTFSLNVSSGQYYSMFLVGRGDAWSSTTDPEYLNVVVTQDTPKPSIPSGDALVRLVIEAPDITSATPLEAGQQGPVDVSINGSIPSGFKNQAFQVPGIGNWPLGFLPATFVPVPAGTFPVAVNETGTSTAITPPQTETFSAGQSYTIIVVEPAGGTPSKTSAYPFTVTGDTFGIQVISD